ncbi:hypothetical protein RhiirA5_437011 [Rhizophagus irregularis]|uniref:Uncharacterized protein n=1 Tax=Rhizophagus irregularis TaxID=588596 RepID=A0A2N0NL34_9GLOM|nr:hypothetical protein RhiirA5_437011 [Rhizophagus irregularis]
MVTDFDHLLVINYPPQPQQDCLKIEVVFGTHIIDLVPNLVFVTVGILKETQKTSNATTDNSRRKVSEADKIALKLGSNSKVTKRKKKNPITLEPIVIVDADQTEQCNTAMQVEMDREVADINVGRISNKTNDTSYYHLMEGLKNCLTQNKEIFQVIYDVKNEQKEFYKKTREQLNELLEKVDQFMIPENSYWKNLASKTCKIQLPILGIYPGGIAFQKAFEAMLEQEKPGYIEKHGPQWMHIYEGRIKPLVIMDLFVLLIVILNNNY